ncbi:hypothetical protein JCM8547_008072 [Rhodosporidiobolus lusitaniae]
MDDSEAHFDSPTAALAHYRTLCSSLQSQLANAEEDIADFTASSKELQQELEKELERMEEAERSLRKEMESERGKAEDWKSKYTTALRDHTTTISHMQRELESLRATEKDLRSRLRDVEMDNDEMEKSGRETSSSLADVENRYNKSLERIALLEEELVTKAQLDEEVQRLKDELRDVNEELAITRDVANAAAATAPSPSPLPSSSAPSPPSSPPPASMSSSRTPPRATPCPTSPANSTPSISLVNPTPLFDRTLPSPSTSTAASSPIDGPSTSSHRFPSSPAYRAPLSSTTSGNPPLARSTRTKQLQSYGLPSSPSSPNFRTGIPSSPSTRGLVSTSSRPSSNLPRTDTSTMLRDMQAMTARVKGLTERLDQRRGRVMRGSAIPRASIGSPTSSSSGMGGMMRSATVRALPTGLGARPRSRMSERDDFSSSISTSSTRERMLQSTRPPSRTSTASASLRTSTLAGRPPSRMSSLSTTSQSSSRPLTPTFPSRSPTPTTSTSRPAWGSSRPSSSTSGATPAAERRRTSSSLSKSVQGGGGGGPGHGRVSSGSAAAAGAGVDLGATIRRPPSSLSTSSSSRPSSAAAGELGSSVNGKAARRSSVGLGMGLGASVNGLARSVIGRRASGIARPLSRQGRAREEGEEIPPVPTRGL